MQWKKRVRAGQRERTGWRGAWPGQPGDGEADGLVRDLGWAEGRGEAWKMRTTSDR